MWEEQSPSNKISEAKMGTEIQMDGGGDAILESKILMIFARFFRTKSMDLYSESFDGVC